jgi:hypothetical protein
MSEEQGVVRAFLELEPLTERILAGERDLKKEALAMVFRLNTQIGRLAASNAGRRSELQRLQRVVNAVTSAIKRDDSVLLRESFEGVRNEVRGLARV